MVATFVEVFNVTDLKLSVEQFDECFRELNQYLIASSIDKGDSYMIQLL